MDNQNKLRHLLELQITTETECTICGGSGLKLKHDYISVSRKIEVEISVCGCVRLERRLKGVNQYTSG